MVAELWARARWAVASAKRHLLGDPFAFFERPDAAWPKSQPWRHLMGSGYFRASYRGRVYSVLEFDVTIDEASPTWVLRNRLGRRIVVKNCGRETEPLHECHGCGRYTMSYLPPEGSKSSRRWVCTSQECVDDFISLTPPPS